LILSEPHKKAIMKSHDNSLTTGNKIRILIVDDNPILREGLKSVLSHSPTFDIVGEAADGLEAVDSVEKFHPDLVLMDLSLPRKGGLDATREIKKKWPGIKIMIFSNYEIPEYRAAVSEAGADGYLSKDSSQAELIQSIQDILDVRKGLHPSPMEETLQ
jgi:two-component system response regulator NreC